MLKNKLNGIEKLNKLKSKKTIVKPTSIKSNNFKKNWNNSSKRILEKNNLQDSALVFYKSKDIKEISKLSGMYNRDEEYQVHYIALIMIEHNCDNSKELTIFPIAYYNYPQKVTRVSVDIEMSDVIAKVEKIQEIAIYAAKELVEELKKEFSDKVENLEFYVSLFNNIHRHP